MKKYSLLLLLPFFSLTAGAQDNFFQINGKADTRYNGALVTLFTFTGDYIRSVDSTYVADGHFSFTGSEYLYEKSVISMGNYPDSVFAAELYLERGPIEVELKQKPVVRSPYITDYRLYADSCRKIERAYAIEGQSQAFYDEGNDRLLSYKYQFKKKYIQNGIGRSLLVNEILYASDPYFYKLYELLPEREKQRYDVQESYKERVRKDKQVQQENKPFPDLTLTNSTGEKQRISDYAGKSELLYLDFWASWCGPCMSQKPHIKELYEKYKDDVRKGALVDPVDTRQGDVAGHAGGGGAQHPGQVILGGVGVLVGILPKGWLAVQNRTAALLLKLIARTIALDVAVIAGVWIARAVLGKVVGGIVVREGTGEGGALGLEGYEAQVPLVQRMIRNIKGVVRHGDAVPGGKEDALQTGAAPERIVVHRGDACGEDGQRHVLAALKGILVNGGQHRAVGQNAVQGVFVEFGQAGGRVEQSSIHAGSLGQEEEAPPVLHIGAEVGGGKGLDRKSVV